MTTGAETLYDKIWRLHRITEVQGETLLYVDLHLVHEATSPQAFLGLDAAGRKVRRPDLTLAVEDHSVPTSQQSLGLSGIRDLEAREQVAALSANARKHEIQLFELGDLRNGIAHVVAPEQGRTQPGMTIVCGDSHTSTHGAFGALAFGLGTSDVKHVLATQTIRQRKSKNFRIRVDGKCPPQVTAKDLALFLLARLGTHGATGYVVEFVGEAVRSLSMEGRMTLCNMSIELGAKAGLVAPDERTVEYLEGRPGAPRGAAFDEAREQWLALVTDDDAVFDKEMSFSFEEVAPMVTWGTNPSEVIPVTSRIPDPAEAGDSARRAMERALDYMGLQPGSPILGLPVDRVFIGSCTNSRIEDLRSAAGIVKGRQVPSGVRAMVVPGSGLVKRQAEEEGLDKIFVQAGFDWREPGCSMCVGMNGDQLGERERCAATSNRNFENRQGRGGRTHLMSPAMAAAAAVTGRITDVRTL